MKSKTSSCNMRIFKKDLTRFAPIWVEYSVLLLIIFYFLWSEDGDITARYSWFLGIFAFVNAIYGFVCAVGLFGYLSNPRECNCVHTFPNRREEYFVVHLVSGLLMALVPNLVFCALNIPLAQNGSVLYTFMGMMLEFLFFYGLAVFCVFLTGRKFAAATIYALLNWISLLIYWAVDVIYLPLLPGVQLNMDVFFRFCPVIQMSFEDLINFNVWHGTDPGQLKAFVLYAAVGVGLIVSSLFLYRRRKLEYAGDFLAIKSLTPVFIVAISIAFGCALAAFGSILFDQTPYLLLAFGLLVGYFSGMMLLRRTVRVFRLKNLIGAATVVAVIFGSIFTTAMDPFGRVYHVPETEQIASVEIRQHETYSDVYKTEDPAVIADILQLHSDILDYGKLNGIYRQERYHVTYRLKNGTTLIRYYWVQSEELLDRVHFYYSQPEFLMDVSTLEELLEHCYYIDIDDYRDDMQSKDIHLTDKEEMKPLLEVFFRECREGKMSEYSEVLENHFYIGIGLEYGQADTEHFWLYIPKTATDTIAVCEEFISAYPTV